MQTHKRFILAVSLASLLSAILIAGLVLLLLVNDGLFSIVANRVGGIKVCTIAGLVHCLLNFLIYLFYSPSVQENKFQITNIFKCCCLLVVVCFSFHAIAVCFGAPFLKHTLETFHFALLLTVLIGLPFCLFFGPSIESWLEIFIIKSTHVGPETVVYFTSSCALLGSWLGAVPIPLDWDKPWQEWPISCVVGAMGGYSLGLLLSALHLPWKYRKLYKSKFF